MGYKNAQSILWWMPKDLSPGERCVVNAIAWGVSDATGTGPIGPEKMRTWSGMEDSGLKSALERLAARGYELRVPIGRIESEGPKNGQLLYAVPGKCRRYTLPEEWRQGPPKPVDNPDERWGSHPTYASEGGAVTPPRWGSDHSMVGQSPHPRGSRGSKSQSVRQAVEYLCEEYGVGEDDGLVIWRRIQDTAPGVIRSPLKYAQRCVGENREKWHQVAPTFPEFSETVEDHQVSDSSGFQAWRAATPEARAAAEAEAIAELGDDAPHTAIFARTCELLRREAS